MGGWSELRSKLKLPMCRFAHCCPSSGPRLPAPHLSWLLHGVRAHKLQCGEVLVRGEQRARPHLHVPRQLGQRHGQRVLRTAHSLAGRGGGGRSRGAQEGQLASPAAHKAPTLLPQSSVQPMRLGSWQGVLCLALPSSAPPAASVRRRGRRAAPRRPPRSPTRAPARPPPGGERGGGPPASIGK